MNFGWCVVEKLETIFSSVVVHFWLDLNNRIFQEEMPLSLITLLC